MQNLRSVISVLALAVLCAPMLQTEAHAQGVIVLPKQGDEKPAEKKPDDKQAPPAATSKPSWIAPTYTPEPKAPPKPQPNRQTTSPIVGAPKPGKGKNPPEGAAPAPLPMDVQKVIDDNRASLAGMLENITRQPTRVFEQPDYMVSPDKDDRVFEKPLKVTMDKIELTEDEMKNVAAGTSIEPKDILKTCEPRFTGAVVGQGDSSELLDVRGKGGVGRSGYKGTIQNITLNFAVACKFAKPPVDKGILIKFGDYYVLGIGQGQCIPKNYQASELALSYDKRGITCAFR